MIQGVLVSNDEVVAVGGRYDRLVTEFLPSNMTLSCAAVGVNISVDKILSLMISHQKMNKHRYEDC
jgi:histidyl-tRNA synthetase